jgi:hypothetical protein
VSIRSSIVLQMTNASVADCPVGGRHALLLREMYTNNESRCMEMMGYLVRPTRKYECVQFVIKKMPWHVLFWFSPWRCLGCQTRLTSSLFNNTTMPPLPPLPVEILCLIFSFLEPHDLSYVSLVCRQFHVLAEPFLWHSCVDTGRFNEVHTYNLFLRSILEQPELARYVKGFYPVYYYDEDCAEDCPGDCAEECRSPPREDTEERCQNAITAINIPEPLKDRLKSDISRREFDAVVALLLCSLPNLENIVFRDIYETGLIYEIFELAQSKSFNWLRNLRTVHLEEKDGVCGVSLYPTFLRVLKIPSLKRFETTHAACEVALEIDPESSSVENIVLRKSALVKEAIQPIIRSCRSLKTFSFSHGLSGFFATVFTPYDAIQALRQHRSTLEELKILVLDFWDAFSWHPEFPAYKIYMGTHLRDFTKLKTLMCEMENLLGLEPGQIRPDRNPPALVDVLPESIESLTIPNVDKQIIPHLQKLEEVKAKRFPNLRQVIVSLCGISGVEDCRPQITGLDVTLLDQYDSIYSAFEI